MILLAQCLPKIAHTLNRKATTIWWWGPGKINNLFAFCGAFSVSHSSHLLRQNGGTCCDEERFQRIENTLFPIPIHSYKKGLRSSYGRFKNKYCVFPIRWLAKSLLLLTHLLCYCHPFVFIYQYQFYFGQVHVIISLHEGYAANYFHGINHNLHTCATAALLLTISLHNARLFPVIKI